MVRAEGVSGKAVLVTAGASGIGLAIAQRFVEAGARVAVTDIDEAALDQIGSRVPAINAVQADMGARPSVTEAIAKATGLIGEIEVLVNNAGIGGPRAAIEDIDAADWQRSLDVNLSGALYSMQAIIPAMKTRGAGAIINVSSTAQRTALPYRTPYVVTKAALAALAHNAARELGPHGIRVNTILPGLINNERGRRLLERVAEADGRSLEAVTDEARRYISMRTVIEEHEIGDMAVFLASDAAAHVTAQEISVDGNLEWDI